MARSTLDDRRPDPTRPESKTTKRGGAKKKVTRRVVALGSAAILSIYAAGYLRTEYVAEQIAAQQDQANAMVRLSPSATTQPTDVPDVAVIADPTVTPVPSTPSAALVRLTPLPSTPRAAIVFPPTPTPTVASTSPYRDGTYVGLGRSRHGDIEATVVIRGGKIVSAAVTGCMTRYPCSRIASLPEQVVSQQNTNLDLVSGATDSSDAYQEAVTNALAKAT